MRDTREQTPIETVATQVPGELAVLLWVPEAKLRADFELPLGTTLANAATQAYVGCDLRGFGSWVFTDNGPVEQGWHGFYFARPFSIEEKTTAFRTVTEVRGGIYWPAVFSSLNVRNFLAYDSNGTQYTADVIWDFQLRDSYDGPTRVIIEYFASHEPHTISMPTSMQPEGGTFYYGVAQVSIPRCLHPSITLEYSTGNTSANFPWQTFSKTFPSTNLMAWPSTLVIDDGETFDNGLYIRRKVTAYRPDNYATAPIITSPTKADIGTTTVTLGGNVTNDGGSTITERGVVVSATATNADPVIGGTGVTKTTAAGTTGVFTVNVTGLTTGKAYTYKAYATNARGTVYTTLDTFTTA